MVDYRSDPTQDQKTLQSQFKRQIIPFSSKRPLFKDGDAISGIYYLLKGVVKVQQISGGETQTLYLAGPGDFLGINDFFQKHSTYNITAVALSQGKAGFLSRDHYFNMIERNPSVGVEILNQMNEQIGRIESHSSILEEKAAYQKIKALVTYYTKAFGVDENCYLNLPLSPEDIADLSGVSKTYMRKLLPSFRRNRVFESKKRRIKVPKLGMLQ